MKHILNRKIEIRPIQKKPPVDDTGCDVVGKTIVYESNSMTTTTIKTRPSSIPVLVDRFKPKSQVLNHDESKAKQLLSDISKIVDLGKSYLLNFKFLNKIFRLVASV